MFSISIFCTRQLLYIFLLRSGNCCLSKVPANVQNNGSWYPSFARSPLQGFVLAKIVSDYDSTMQAHLKYPHVADKKGKLPLWIYSPEFLADPSHRKKLC